MKCFSELASHRPDEGVGDTNTNRFTTELSLSSFIVWAGSHSRSYALIRSCRHQVGGCLSNRPLVMEFVRNFDREDATPYQEVANPLVLVSAVRRKHASLPRHAWRLRYNAIERAKSHRVGLTFRPR